MDKRAHSSAKAPAKGSSERNQTTHKELLSSTRELMNYPEIFHHQLNQTFSDTDALVKMQMSSDSIGLRWGHSSLTSFQEILRLLAHRLP